MTHQDYIVSEVWWAYRNSAIFKECCKAPMRSLMVIFEWSASIYLWNFDIFLKANILLTRCRKNGGKVYILSVEKLRIRDSSVVIWFFYNDLAINPTSEIKRGTKSAQTRDLCRNCFSNAGIVGPEDYRNSLNSIMSSMEKRIPLMVALQLWWKCP